MGEKYCSSKSLDYWRKFFRCSDTDICEVIKNAILVASSDRPDEFLARRDEIARVMYTCLQMQGSDCRTKIQTPEGGRDGGKVSSEETLKWSNDFSTSNALECLNIGEFGSLTGKIDKQQQTFDEVHRIKRVLDNWEKESEDVLSKLLRWLQLMEMSVKILRDTKIGIAVRGVQKHKSKPIQQLARTLVDRWKRLAHEEWENAANGTILTISGSVNSSTSKRESLHLSELKVPPSDMESLLATQPASSELPEVAAQPACTTEFTENGRRPQKEESDSSRKDKGSMKGEELNQQEIQRSLLPKRLKIKILPMRDTQRQNPCEELRMPELVQSSPKSQVTAIKAAADRSTQGRQNSSSDPAMLYLTKDVAKENEELTYQNKLEVSKRKLRDRYEEINAKRRRIERCAEARLTQPTTRKGQRVLS